MPQGQSINVQSLITRSTQTKEALLILENRVTEAQATCATIRLDMGLTDYCRPDNHAELKLDRYERIEENLEKLSNQLQSIQCMI
jgi:hypothetical protein